MKILLWTEDEKKLSKSGLGKAINHQKKALDYENIKWTTDINDDFDILHINTYFLKSYFLVNKAKRMGKKIVFHAHSTEEDFRNSFILSNFISPLFKKWLIKMYNYGDVIITPTPYSKKILESYGIKKKIYALSNGIEIDKFKRNEEKGNEFRKKYNIKKDEKVIIGIGLYIERKGILDFVELAKRLPQYKFIWFGYSPLVFSPNKIKKAVNTKLDNLIFAGYVPNDEINAAMSGCDLYIFPTLEETEGIPIIEACACGTDAIVRDIKIFDDWLIDGVNVYKASNVDEFETKIKNILEHKLPKVTDNAKQVAEDRDLKEIGKKLKHIYEEVLEKNS